MKALTCQEFVELLTRYLEGVLDQAEQARFDEHLAVCKGCDRYLAQFRRTIDTLGHLPVESISGGTRDHLLDVFRNWHAG
jgi:anti-sigma factor RsiW